MRHPLKYYAPRTRAVRQRGVRRAQEGDLADAPASRGLHGHGDPARIPHRRLHHLRGLRAFDLSEGRLGSEVTEVAP